MTDEQKKQDVQRHAVVITDRASGLSCKVFGYIPRMDENKPKPVRRTVNVRLRDRIFTN
jgi:hypothetical protein